MAGRLEGKIALITGGASGIGLGTVELFLAEGAKIVCADLQDEKGAVLEQRFPGRLTYVRCDVTQEADIAAACAAAKASFGGLDVLFNNAGTGGHLGGVGEMTTAGWDAIFAVLVRGPALGMKHARAAMLARGGGSIINTASIAGLEAGWGPLAYSTAKGAVLTFTRGLAAEIGPQGVRVNAIAPGLILGSKFHEIHTTAEGVRATVAGIPLGRPGNTDDVARVVVFLASEFDGFLTGITVDLNGGSYMA